MLYAQEVLFSNFLLPQAEDLRLPHRCSVPRKVAAGLPSSPYSSSNEAIAMMESAKRSLMFY